MNDQISKPIKASRVVLPVSSGSDHAFVLRGVHAARIKPGESADISTFPQYPFFAEEMVIGENGPWNIERITIDGWPIDEHHFGTRIRINLPITKEIAIRVRYLGSDPDGQHFNAGVVGTPGQGAGD